MTAYELSGAPSFSTWYEADEAFSSASAFAANSAFRARIKIASLRLSLKNSAQHDPS